MRSKKLIGHLTLGFVNFTTEFQGIQISKHRTSIRIASEGRYECSYYTYEFAFIQIDPKSGRICLPGPLLLTHICTCVCICMCMCICMYMYMYSVQFPILRVLFLTKCTFSKIIWDIKCARRLNFNVSPIIGG